MALSCGNPKMLEEYLKIPKERIAVVIGTNGETKREIEKLTNTKIEVDSEDGDIDVSAEEGNAINFYIALNIIKAIGRGFSPEHAFLLKNEENTLEIIDLKEELGKSEKMLKTKRGRVIGRKGKARKEIEEKTNCLVSVYGKTIAIIGKVNNIENARKAVDLLLGGASHKTAHAFLARKERKKFEL